MPLALNIPINVSPDAAARVAGIGLQSELDAMLGHTKEAVPGLRSISVYLDLRPEGGDPVVLIMADITEPGPDGPGMADDRIELKWDRWAIATFPPDVNRHFCMM